MQCTTNAISYMLYADPLFKWIPSDESGLNVLVIGQDEHTTEFLDVCLQAGQMLDHALNITVLSPAPSELKKRYLSSRPALAQFVNIDHSLDKDNTESYGNLTFSKAELHADTISSSITLIQDLLLHAVEQSINEHVHYVFISLGKDGINAQIASQISQVAEELDMRCAVHFVATEESEEPSGSAPVYVNKPIDTQAYNELERIAFNVHLCWKGFHHTHVQDEWRSFRGSANWRDSLRFAVSIPYKLADLGISVSSDLLTTAKELNMILRDPEKSEVLYRLAAVEHRRWLLDKVCSGWTAPAQAKGITDYSFCLAALSNHDDKRQIHNCICRSSASFPLSNWTDAMWDDPAVDVLGLDELDRSSVELHRFYQKAAARLSADNIENTASLIAIRRSIPDTAVDLRNCYDHFCLCIKSIIDGSVGYAKRYADYEGKLVKMAGLVSADCMKAVQTSLPAVKRMIFPAIQRNLYVDYKKIDLELIKEIPFILTYKQPAHLIVGIQDLQDSSSDTVLLFVVGKRLQFCILQLGFFQRSGQVGRNDGNLMASKPYIALRPVACDISACLVRVYTARAVLQRHIGKNALSAVDIVVGAVECIRVLVIVASNGLIREILLQAKHIGVITLNDGVMEIDPGVDIIRHFRSASCRPLADVVRHDAVSVLRLR